MQRPFVIHPEGVGAVPRDAEGLQGGQARQRGGHLRHAHQLRRLVVVGEGEVGAGAGQAGAVVTHLRHREPAEDAPGRDVSHAPGLGQVAGLGVVVRRHHPREVGPDVLHLARPPAQGQAGQAGQGVPQDAVGGAVLRRLGLDHPSAVFREPLVAPAARPLADDAPGFGVAEGQQGVGVVSLRRQDKPPVRREPHGRRQPRRLHEPRGQEAVRRSPAVTPREQHQTSRPRQQSQASGEAHQERQPAQFAHTLLLDPATCTS